MWFSYMFLPSSGRQSTKKGAIFLFVKYLPEDGRKRPKHVGLPLVCISLYPVIVQLLECVLYLSYCMEHG